MNETETILGELYKINGKQRTNFRIFNNYIKKNGSKGFSKWIYYLDATKEQKQKATHRTLLKNEIVLDYDPEKNETLNEITTKVKKVCEDLKNKQIAYKCYFTGSRGYHIHIFRYKMFFMNNIERIEYRNCYIEYYKAEAQKNSDNVPIAIENIKHWKSSKIKKRCFF